MNTLAGIHIGQGRLSDAASVFRDLLDSARKSGSGDDPQSLGLMNNLAYVLKLTGDYPASEELMIETLTRKRRVLGDTHFDTLLTKVNLGLLYQERQMHSKAEPLFRELYETAPSTQMGDGDIAEAMSYYGPCLVSQSRFADAEQPLLKAAQRLDGAGLGQSQHMRRVVAALVEVYQQTGESDQAANWRSKLPAPHPATAAAP
jgi:hypothetical protein